MADRFQAMNPHAERIIEIIGIACYFSSGQNVFGWLENTVETHFDLHNAENQFGTKKSFRSITVKRYSLL